MFLVKANWVSFSKRVEIILTSKIVKSVEPEETGTLSVNKSTSGTVLEMSSKSQPNYDKKPVMRAAIEKRSAAIFCCMTTLS